MNDVIDTFGPAVWQNAVQKIYVSSTHASASDSNAGTPDSPFATLDGAMGADDLAAGDIIYLMPGHAETYSTTGVKATFDVAGVYIIGIGEGASRPTFTFSHTGATWTWSAASVSLANCLFVTGVDLVVTFATISGADAHLINCETRDTTNKEVINDFTCTGDRLVVDGHFKNGYTSGDANVAVFTMAGVDRAEIQNCRFITKVTTGIVNFTATNTAIEVHKCDFLVDSTTNLSKNVVATGGTNTWGVWDSFDLGASTTFSGGNAVAVASDDIGTAYSLLTSSATSVTTHVTSVGTTVDSVQTNLTSSATSVATGVDSVQTNLTSSATSIGTDLSSDWTSWNARYTTDLSILRSEIDST